MSFERTRRIFGAFVLTAASCAVFTLSAVAQDNPNAGTVTAKENEYGKKVQEGTDVAAKMKIAEKFVKDFPKSAIREKFALYLSGQVMGVADITQRAGFIETYRRLFNKPEETDLIVPTQLEVLTTQKNYEQAFQLGNDYFTRRDGDIRTRLFLAIEGANVTRGGNKQFAEQTQVIITRAVALIEAGVKPKETTDDDWKLAQSTWHSQLYQSLGFVYTGLGKQADAMAAFSKATTLNPKDFNSWTMYGFAINANYQALVRKYNISEGAEKAEILKQAQAEIDKVVDIYARVVALTDGDPAQAEFNKQIRGDLETYYKFRHNGTTTGLPELIAKYKN